MFIIITAAGELGCFQESLHRTAAPKQEKAGSFHPSTGRFTYTGQKGQGGSGDYQGRKKQRTTNALFFVDNSGQPLAMSTPQAGNHTDLFEIKILFEELCALLEEAGVNPKGASKHCCAL